MHREFVRVSAWAGEIGLRIGLDHAGGVTGLDRETREIGQVGCA